MAWQIYHIAGSRDRQVGIGFVGLISSLAILHLCEEYDATHEDFEKVMLIDEKMYEIRHKQDEEARELKKKTEELNNLTSKNLSSKSRRKK